MPIRTYRSLTSPPAEIGRDGDWKSMAMVEEIGASNDGQTKLMLSLGRSRIELWHQSGLKMRIDLEPMLDEAAEVLRLEAESEKEPANAETA